jgi:hypothetical protein
VSPERAKDLECDDLSPPFDRLRNFSRPFSRTDSSFCVFDPSSELLGATPPAVRAYAFFTNFSATPFMQ